MEKELFDNLVASLQEAIDIKQGKRRAARTTVIPELIAKAVRSKLKLSQKQFAALLGVSQRTVEKWEQGIAKPSGAARSLLIVADKNPQAVLEALH
jgi:putative transcriptional regulator